MLVDGGQGAQAEVLADLFDGGRVALLLDVPREEVEDLFLPPGQVHGEKRRRILSESQCFLPGAGRRGRGMRVPGGREPFRLVGGRLAWGPESWAEWARAGGNTRGPGADGSRSAAAAAVRPGRECPRLTAPGTRPRASARSASASAARARASASRTRASASRVGSLGQVGVGAVAARGFALGRCHPAPLERHEPLGPIGLFLAQPAAVHVDAAERRRWPRRCPGRAPRRADRPRAPGCARSCSSAQRPRASPPARRRPAVRRARTLLELIEGGAAVSTCVTLDMGSVNRARPGLDDDPLRRRAPRSRPRSLPPPTR